MTRERKDELEILAEMTAERVARKIISEHRNQCDIKDIKKDFYGNGRRGMKADIQEILFRLSMSGSVKRWVFDRLVGPVLAAAITALIVILLK